MPLAHTLVQTGGNFLIELICPYSHMVDWRHRKKSCRQIGRMFGIRRSRRSLRFQPNRGYPKFEFFSCRFPPFKKLVYHNLPHFAVLVKRLYNITDI